MITAIRTFSTQSIAAFVATACGFIRRCRITSYTYMTDADVLAIKAYLFSLPPVHAKTPENTLTFPFNQRWAMTFWSALFNADSRFAPNSARRARNGIGVPISRGAGALWRVPYAA